MTKSDTNVISTQTEMKDKLIPSNVKINHFKIEMKLTIQDVKRQAFLLYGSVSGFSRKMQITEGLGSRLLSGSYVPLKPKSIQKIADCLNIDPIILTQIYDSLKFAQEGKQNEI